MTLQVLGVSHRTASPEVRAASAITSEQVRELMAEAAGRGPGLEVVTVATCNRVEFYLAGEDALEQWRGVLAAVCPAAPAMAADNGWYRLEGVAAFEHLLRVACGLDSQVLGDGQILGQLRRGVDAAQRLRLLGRVLSPAMSTALRIGRRARRESDIGRGAPGIGSTVTSAVLSHGVDRDEPILVLGTGEAGRLIVRELRKAGYHRLSVANRSGAAAAELGAELGVGVVPWSQLAAALADVPVLVTATAAPAPVVQTLPERRSRLLIVDAGFPAQVAPQVAGPSVTLVALGDLAGAADSAAARRRDAVPVVEGIIHLEAQAWQSAQDRTELEATIKSLHREARRCTREAAALLATEHQLPVDAIERTLTRSVKALLHDHVTQLRSLQPRSPSPLS